MKEILYTLLTLFVCIGLILAQNTTKKDTLISLVNEEGVVKLNSESFNRFAEGKRDYHFVVFMTALDPQFNCEPCRELEPEILLIAKTYQKSRNNKELFFGYLDFDDGEEIYYQLGLESAPNVLYYSPQNAGDSSNFVKYDIKEKGFKAEALADFFSNQAGFTVKAKRPLNYTTICSQLALGVGAAIAFKLIYSNLYHRTTWAVVSVLIVLIMTTGHMWTRIRGPAYIKHTPEGQINYVTDGVSLQLGVETHIVASVYGFLGLSILSLIKVVPRIEGKGRQNCAALLCTGCIVLIFSGLFALFHIKHGGYPYKLLI